LYFNLTLKHPFANLVYTGFDVRGVFITGGDKLFPEGGLIANLDDGIPPDHPRLLNPSGWTRMFNPTEFPEGSGELNVLKYTRGRYATEGPFTATLNPYIAFRIDEPRRYFPSWAAETREVRLRLPDGPIKLGYAVDACWMPPLKTPVTDPITDFPLTANCPEPYQVWATQGMGLKPEPGSSCKVTVRTLDWQDPVEVSQVVLEAPDLYSGEIEATFSTVQEEAVVWEVQVPNSLGAEAGKYPCLITAWDSDEDPELGSVKAYQVFTLNVTETGLPLGDVVFVPGGEFLMGCHEDDGMWCNPPDNKPQHWHHVDDFYISVFKIRISEFVAFMADGGYERPELWSEEGWEWQIANLEGEPHNWNEAKCHGEAWPDYPVVVSYWEAEAFANWVGGRLPQEDEWEYVAGGSDYYLWPWGNEWGPVYLDCSPPECVGGDTGTPYPVDRFYPDDLSPLGVSGIAGNRSEWCIEYFDQDIYEEWAVHGYSAPSIGDPYPEARVLRGHGEVGGILIPELFFIVNRVLTGPSDQQAFRVVFDP
jgi:formylglycine-generating enzyme required for sulfatase activity